MKKWLELIEKKEEEILEAGLQAYKEALECQNLRYIVELNENGEVTTWADIAGGNSFHSSVFNGKAIEIFEYCFEGFESEVSDETVEEKFKSKGLEKLYKELEDAADENYSTVISEILSGDNQKAKELLDECYKEEIEMMISEFAPDTVSNDLYNLKNKLEEEEQWK